MPGLQVRAALAAMLVSVAVAPAAAVTVGTVNGFAPGDTQGWFSGSANPTPPQTVASGGPGGAGDAYLLLQSNGTGGAGGRLVAIAGPAWSGDYVSAGVSGIHMDVNNFGSTDLSLRLWLSGPFSTDPITVPSGSGWQPVFFATTPAALTGAGSLQNVTELRLYHSVLASVPAGSDFIAATLGVDNISAVPEPGAAWLLLGGLAFGAWRLRRA